jgi:hypothetical protein
MQEVTLGPGTTPWSSLDVDEAGEEVVATATRLKAITLINLTDAKLYAFFYNKKLADVTVGETEAYFSLPVPTAGSTDGGGVVPGIPAEGIEFDTAVSVAVTTSADGTGAPSANACAVLICHT